MSRIKRGGPALFVAVLALVAAVAGTSLAGSEPDATSAVGAKKLAKKASKKAKKAKKKAKQANKKAKAAQGSADGAIANAASAQGDADAALSQLGDVSARSIRYVRTAPDATETTILDLKGLKLVAKCDTGDLDVEARSSVDDTIFETYAVDNGGSPALVNSHDRVGLDAAPLEWEELIDGQDDGVSGHSEWIAPNGVQVSIFWAATEGSGGFEDPECVFTGHALGSG